MNIAVRLDHLKKASITTHSLVFAALWKHLSVPPTIKLFVSLLDSLPPHRGPPPMQLVASVLLDILPTYNLFLMIQSTSGWVTPSIAFSSSTSASSFTIGSARGKYISLSGLRDFLNPFISSLAEDRMHILDVQARPFIPYLHDLYRVTWSTNSLSCMLSHAGEIWTGLPGARGIPRFPRLRTLIVDVDCVAFQA
jgi:hypothetical protein